jgi:transcriptional regulator with XRE-family HTH domain
MRSPYSPAEQAQVAGLRAEGLTHRAISQRTGIPRTSVTKILSKATAVQVVTEATRDQVSKALWATVSAASTGAQEAITELRAIIADPKERAAAKVRAAEGLARVLSVTAEQHQLLVGQSTSHVNVNARLQGQGMGDEWQMTPEEVRQREEERRTASEFIRVIESSTDAELEEWLADRGIDELREAFLERGPEGLRQQRLEASE